MTATNNQHQKPVFDTENSLLPFDLKDLFSNAKANKTRTKEIVFLLSRLTEFSSSRKKSKQKSRERKNKKEDKSEKDFYS